jgi:hypothetical protein
MKQRLLISFSGGRTSAYMTWWILNVWEDRRNWEITIVFANTGLEEPETLLFVHRCAINWGIEIIWVEAKHKDEHGNPFSEKGWSVRHQVVDYFTAARAQKLVNGGWSWTPFEEMISVLGIPSTNSPFCSFQLKKYAIESYAESIGWTGYYKAIGIRIDEAKRVNENWEKELIKYFLIDPNPTWKRDVVIWWRKQDFDLQVDTDLGNCGGCWKKDMPRLLRIAKAKPQKLEWWQYVTEKYGFFMPREMVKLIPPFNFYRGNLSPNDILQMAAKYDSLTFEQISMFSEVEKETGCGESCEAF